MSAQFIKQIYQNNRIHFIIYYYHLNIASLHIIFLQYHLLDITKNIYIYIYIYFNLNSKEKFLQITVYCFIGNELIKLKKIKIFQAIYIYIKKRLYTSKS